MTTPLEHRHIIAAVGSLSDAKIVNLDATIRSLVNPLAESLAKSGVGAEVGLHVLCCNEYFLVTGLQGGGPGDVERFADSIRAALENAVRHVEELAVAVCIRQVGFTSNPKFGRIFSGHTITKPAWNSTQGNYVIIKNFP